MNPTYCGQPIKDSRGGIITSKRLLFDGRGRLLDPYTKEAIRDPMGNLVELDITLSQFSKMLDAKFKIKIKQYAENNPKKTMPYRQWLIELGI